MATKRRRGESWHYTIRRQGLLDKPVYLTFASEAEGDEFVRRAESMLARGIVPEGLVPDRKRTTALRDQVRQYRAQQHISDDDGRTLDVVLGRLPIAIDLAELSFTWASGWVTSLKREQNLSPSTIRHHVGALARCLDWIAAHGGVPFNPLRLLPKGYSTYTDADGAAVQLIEGAAKDSRERDRRLQGDEELRIRAVLAGAKPEGKQRPLELPEVAALVLLFDLALETAMRLSEMYTTGVEQVDLSQRTIFLDRTKNGDRRQIPLSSVAMARLQGGLPASGLLFPWWDGTKAGRRKTTSRLSRQFGRIFDAAGLVDFNFHDLRHEATSRLFERTSLSDVEIAKITGHRSPRQLMRYANLRASTLAERLW